MQQIISQQSDKAELAMEAIVERQSLTAIYNGKEMTIEPHQIFVRHDSLYLAAFNPAKSRRHDEDPSLGEYNLAGLSDLSLKGQKFEPLPSFDGQPQRQDDKVLICVLTASD